MIKPDEVKKLTLREKLLLMEAIWDDLSGDEDLLEVPQRHKEMLDEREQKIQTGEAKFMDWETAKKEINKTVE